MGRVGKLIEFIRNALGSDVKVDRGGGDTRTVQHFSAPGDDSVPLAGDFAQTIPQVGTGRDSAVGYVDPNSDQIAQPGEKRIYSRNASTGETVAEVWLQNDGTVVAQNDTGGFELDPDGTVIIGNLSGGTIQLLADGTIFLNGVIIDLAGNITSPGIASASTVAASSSMTAAGKEIVGHNHGAGTYNIGGTPVTGTSGANN